MSLREEMGAFNGMSIAKAKKEIKKKLSTDPLVSNFSIQYKLPNVLRVDVVVKSPIFSLKSSLSGKYASVSEGGTVLVVADNSSLPTVNIEGDVPGVGQTVNDKYLFALKLIDGVNEMYQINKGVVEGDTLLVDLPGGLRVIFPLVDADRDLLLGSLRLIYSNIQKEGTFSYSQLDLRFGNPVLR